MSQRSSPDAGLSAQPMLPPLSTFVGRRRELAEVERLLESTRLLTITGAGGAGKTRLALCVANLLAETYPDGAFLVPLESLGDPAMVPRQLTIVLGVREEPDHPLVETIIGYLRPRRALLLLDNCEHLAPDCAVLSERLLRTCAGLRILATSRQPLGLVGETTWRIPSLAVPNSERLPPVERLRQVESVQLFAERASATLSGFAVTQHNAAAVAEICRRLDGMPLALELAAARVRVLGVEQIAARLDDRFRLLTGGSPTALRRQQTLLGTLDWSHDLLNEAERRLMRRFAVFAGGWTLEAAEVVCTADIAPSDILDLLSQLVDKSLVSADAQPDGAMRYRLLESIRQYATDKLRAAGEEVLLRRRHAAWILSLAEAIGQSTTGPDQAAALERLLPELENLRTALDFAVVDPPTAEAGLRGCVSAYRLWLVYGFLGEGRRRLVQVANLETGPVLEPWRTYALFTAATLAMFQGDFAAARALVEDSLSIARATGNGFQVGEALSVLALLLLNQGEPTRAWGIAQEGLALCRHRIAQARDPIGAAGNEFARGYYGQGWPVAVLGRTLLIVGVLARVRGNPARAVEFYEESLDCLRQQGDLWFIGQVLSNLGLVSVDCGETDRARHLFDEALRLRRALGDRTGIARSLNDLGGLAYTEGDLEAAHAFYAEQLSIVRELGDRSGIADVLVALGQMSRSRGDLHAARQYLAESLTIRAELGHRLAMPTVLNELSELAAAAGDAVRAISLASAAAALRERVGSTTALPEPRGPLVASQSLDQAAASAAWANGRAIPEDQLIVYALAEPASAAPRSSRPRQSRERSHVPLSAREMAVARLIALGRTNRQIALELTIAEGTADRHVSNILAKLGVGSRAQVAVWLVERGLLPPAEARPG